LVQLLERAACDEPPITPFGEQEPSRQGRQKRGAPKASGETFDPAMVSEALWTEWRTLVRRLGVSEESMGRVAPSLQNLPTVIWHTPLSQYLGYSVSEIRQLRTHGEKRVRCVLEVFHSVYHQLKGADSSADLKRRLTPRHISEVQDWVDSRLVADVLPGEQEAKKRFVVPLLEQIRIDSGDTVYRLAAERLGLSGEPMSVRAQARSLSVTRARIYQLLDDCSKVMTVRWPEGERQLDELVRHFQALGYDGKSLYFFFEMQELCFPKKQREPARRVPAASRTSQVDESLVTAGAST
jgi:hypothetical protein